MAGDNSYRILQDFNCVLNLMRCQYRVVELMERPGPEEICIPDIGNTIVPDLLLSSNFSLYLLGLPKVFEHLYVGLILNIFP